MLPNGRKPSFCAGASPVSDGCFMCRGSDLPVQQPACCWTLSDDWFGDVWPFVSVFQGNDIRFDGALVPSERRVLCSYFLKIKACKK